jgi:integrase
MPKKARELSALETKRLIMPGMHFVGGVPGLALQVLPSGGRTWILRATITGRRRDMGLGGYPEVTLARAREKAALYRDQIRDGRSPLAEAHAARSALRALVSVTFQQASENFIDSQRASWSNAKHAEQWQNTLQKYAHPLIGDLNVAHVSVAHVIKILEQPIVGEGKFWEVRTVTAVRLRGRIEKILDWAKGRGLRSGDNPAAWRGNLEAQLPKASKVTKVKHHPAVSLDDMAAFMEKLRLQKGIAAKALEFAILTAARSGEVRGATWSEVDMRMKAGKEHRVPLSDHALRLLTGLARIEGTDLIFSAPRGGMLSDMTLSALMRRMNRPEVPHGFRSTFRDWAAELTFMARNCCQSG